MICPRCKCTRGKTFQMIDTGKVVKGKKVVACEDCGHAKLGEGVDNSPIGILKQMMEE